MMLMPVLEYHQQHDEANKEIEVDSWSFGRDLMTKTYKLRWTWKKFWKSNFNSAISSIKAQSSWCVV